MANILTETAAEGGDTLVDELGNPLTDEIPSPPEDTEAVLLPAGCM
jgi:hypothetical protein